MNVCGLLNVGYGNYVYRLEHTLYLHGKNEII